MTGVLVVALVLVPGGVLLWLMHSRLQHDVAGRPEEAPGTEEEPLMVLCTWGRGQGEQSGLRLWGHRIKGLPDPRTTAGRRDPLLLSMADVAAALLVDEGDDLGQRYSGAALSHIASADWLRFLPPSPTPLRAEVSVNPVVSLPRAGDQPSIVFVQANGGPSTRDVRDPAAEGIEENQQGYHRYLWSTLHEVAAFQRSLIRRGLTSDEVAGRKFALTVPAVYLPSNNFLRYLRESLDFHQVEPRALVLETEFGSFSRLCSGEDRTYSLSQCFHALDEALEIADGFALSAHGASDFRPSLLNWCPLTYLVVYPGRGHHGMRSPTVESWVLSIVENVALDRGIKLVADGVRHSDLEGLSTSFQAVRGPASSKVLEGAPLPERAASSFAVPDVGFEAASLDGLFSLEPRGEDPGVQ